MPNSSRRVTWMYLPWVAMMFALPVQAAEPQRCATIVEDPARLACYDAVFGAPVRPAAAAAAATVAIPEEQFGLAPVQVRKKPEPPAEPATPESIESVLKELTKRRTGELIYTLENGQRWIQVEADSAGKLAPGAVVTIRKASMGSYKLVSGNVAARVRRIE